MKLKTKGSPAKDRAHHGSTDDFIHDAAAAHALMQAIEELKAASEMIDADGIPMPVREGLPWLKWRADELKWRADELMLEWGFES